MEGAIYTPASVIVPTLGLISHVTAGVVTGVKVFINTAVNCWLSPADRVGVPGATVTAMGGSKVTIAVAVIWLLDLFVAVTVTARRVAITGGAVYRPELEMESPFWGVIVQ